MLERILEEIPEFITYWNGIFFLRAMVKTLGMATLGCSLGFIFGFVLVFIRRTPGLIFLPARLLMIAYVEIFRRVPYLVLLFLILFGAKALGFTWSLFMIGMVGIVIISIAFIGEIIRAGLDSVHQNQWDTAEAMNFGRIMTLWQVILPQAWKVIIPPAFSFFVMFIKDTALASQVGVLELTLAARVFNNKGFHPVLAFGVVLVLYFIISYPLNRFGWWLEAHLKAARTRAVDSAVADRTAATAGHS